MGGVAFDAAIVGAAFDMKHDSRANDGPEHVPDRLYPLARIEHLGF